MPAVRGLLFSNTSISKPDILTEAVYLKWYFGEHIPDVIKTGAVDAGLFYRNIKKVGRPYLALYPLQDMSFLGSDEFKKIRVKSDYLPGTGVCYDVMEADVRYYKQIQFYGREEKTLGDGRYLILVGTERSDSGTAEDIDAWYREEHLEMLSKLPGYLRTRRYELTFSRTNLESKIMKGYATEEEKAGASSGPKPPTYLALHEFDALQLPLEELKETGNTEWSNRVLTGMKTGEIAIYRLEHTHLKP